MHMDYEAPGFEGRRITDIGTSDKLYLYQMEALTDPIMGFNRYEKRLQPVTKQWSVGNKTTVSR